VIADPLNANRFFVGTVGGGIWTTTNGGVTWTPLTDKQATLHDLVPEPLPQTQRRPTGGTGNLQHRLKGWRDQPGGLRHSEVGDPNNPNRLYAAVTAPNAAGNAPQPRFS
jgi:hypothetical protein